MTCLSEYLARLARNMSPPRLFPEPPRIGFAAEQSRCEACGAPLKALKTRTRKAVTLHLGAFRVHESVAACRECGRIHASPELRRLLPPSSNFGYDVVGHGSGPVS